MTLTAERARALLDYDPETGGFTRKPRPRSDFNSHNAFATWNTQHAWRPATTNTIVNGYLRISIDGHEYRAHRVAWLVVHGYWPKHIDHIDGDRSNNRIANLRDVTNRENCRNMKIGRRNKTGVLGVYRRGNRWVASIRSGSKNQHLGYFDTKNDAVHARKAAEREHGYHENHGRAA